MSRRRRPPQPIRPISDADWRALLEAHGIPTAADDAARVLEARDGETVAPCPACGRRVRARIDWPRP